MPDAPAQRTHYGFDAPKQLLMGTLQPGPLGRFTTKPDFMSWN